MTSCADRFTRGFESPIGTLWLVAGPSALRESGFHEPPAPRESVRSRAPISALRILDQAAQELTEYFAGHRRTFTVPLKTEGTGFQRQVWQALREIPYGRTWSYGDLARRLGRPGASRAVGGANHRNPLPVLIPCHRVIGADGSLVGFGGGLERKRFLLKMEARHGDPLDAPLFRMNSR